MSAHSQDARTKKPALAGFFETRRYNSGKRADVRGEAALVTCSLVLVDQAARGVAIHHRLRGGKRGFCAGLVLRFDRLHDALDRAAHHGAGAGIALTCLLGLTGTLLRGFDVGQGVTPEKRLLEKRRGILRAYLGCVNYEGRERSTGDRERTNFPRF